MPSVPTARNHDDESTGSSTESSCSSPDEQQQEESQSSSTWSAEAAQHQDASTEEPPEKERQLLLLMLLAQVCALHDPTPRTFTVHVLELFERGILDRESIRFLFRMGLVPSSTAGIQTPPLLLLEAEQATASAMDDTTTSSGGEHQQQQQHKQDAIQNQNDRLELLQTTTSPTLPPSRTRSMQDVRAEEASAIRSHLEQGSSSKLPCSTPTSNNNSTNNNTSSSWAVEHHPLSLSRYQREFRQVRLLNSGSFGHVYHVQHKMDGKDYAIKRVAFGATGYSNHSVTQAVREVQCLAQCDHPHCVRYYTSWLEPSWMTGSGGSGQQQQQQLLLTQGGGHSFSSFHEYDDQTRSKACSSSSRRFSFDGHADDNSWDNATEHSEWTLRSKDDSFLGKQDSSPKQQQQSSSYRYEICLFIQMQLCNPSTLADWIRQRNSTKVSLEKRAGPAILIFTQLVSGMAHVHEKGILHRDLKPANIFMGDNGRFKIGDFGLSKLLQRQDTFGYTPPSVALPNTATNDGDPLTAGIGTASYAAPEQLESKTYGPEADVFSMGLILLELLCSFGTEHERIRTFHDCRRRQVLPSWLTTNYPEVASVILRCTHPYPAKRPSASDLMASHVLTEQDVLRRQLQTKEVELEKQRCVIAEKDRVIEALRKQVKSMSTQQDGGSAEVDCSSRGDKKDDNIKKMHQLGAVESPLLSEDDDDY